MKWTIFCCISSLAYGSLILICMIDLMMMPKEWQNVPVATKIPQLIVWVLLENLIKCLRQCNQSWQCSEHEYKTLSNYNKRGDIVLCVYSNSMSFLLRFKNSALFCTESLNTLLLCFDSFVCFIRRVSLKA